jgi:hypothetical protein
MVLDGQGRDQMNTETTNAARGASDHSGRRFALAAAGGLPVMAVLDPIAAATAAAVQPSKAAAA